MARIWTNAPAAYDYGHTTEMETAEDRFGGTARLVDVAPGDDAETYLTDYQRGRYQSGAYYAVNPERFAADFRTSRPHLGWAEVRVSEYEGILMHPNGTEEYVCTVALRDGRWTITDDGADPLHRTQTLRAARTWAEENLL